MILSRWIKNNRYRDEIEKTISFGSPSIKFAKYKFNSNDSTSSLSEWLTAGTYTGTQYIGFFKTESIKSWLTFNQVLDRTSTFVTANFFTYDISQVVSSLDITQEIIKLERDDIKDVNNVVQRKDNTFQYFTPPGYPITYEDGSVKETVSNDGEIDVVASNMVVYGILSSPENILSKNNQVPRGYTDENIALINKILEEIRNKGMGYIPNLLNEDEVKKSVDTINFDIIDKILRENFQNAKITELCTSRPQYFERSGTFYKIIRNPASLNVLSLLRKTLLKIVPGNFQELFKYSKRILEESEKLLKYLLYITKFLNSSDHQENMIEILNPRKTKIESQEDNMASKQQRIKNKYLKYKIKYLNLKNQTAGNNLTIPNSITTIDERAYYRAKLTSVTIPNSVTTIGERAFSVNELTSVTIPNSVTTIGNGAFIGNKLTSVIIPNSVKTIGNNAFANNQLTSVIIGISVTTIDNFVFANNQLTSVTIPNSVTTIGNNAFKNNQLTSIIIPNSVTTIGNNAFEKNKLTSVTIGNSVTTICNDAFENNQLTSIIIPNSVTTIGNNAFLNNQLTSIIIPNSVTTIGNNAFVNNQLKSVIIPNSVTTIGNDAFVNNKITKVTMPIKFKDREYLFDISKSWFGNIKFTYI